MFRKGQEEVGGKRERDGDGQGEDRGKWKGKGTEGTREGKERNLIMTEIKDDKYSARYNPLYYSSVILGTS